MCLISTSAPPGAVERAPMSAKVAAQETGGKTFSIFIKMYCSTECISGLSAPNMGINCSMERRNDCPAKLILFRCDVAIPTGEGAAVATALAGLLTAATMGATGLLKDFVWGDTATAEQRFADCGPAETLVTGRELTFSDYNASDKASDGTARPFADRQFWRTVMSKKGAWNVGWTTCSGKLYTASANGVFMPANIHVFQADDRSTEGQCIEVKRGVIRFNGDPLATFPEPLIDLSKYLVENPELEALYR